MVSGNKPWQRWGSIGLGIAIGLALGLILPVRGNESVVESNTVPLSPMLGRLPGSPVGFSESSPGISPRIRRYAQSITVRVLAGDNRGSGILIRQQGGLYTVLTNQHVLLFGKGQSYRIETADGKIHSATGVEAGRFNPQDLGLIQFRSIKSYATAELSRLAKPVFGESVVAAGFPFADPAQGLVLLAGKIEMLQPQAFAGGYQIGYTSFVQKGMSGGPLLNLQGQVVGINGIHKYPLWGNPYVFSDGHFASAEEKQRMSRLSWAIPMIAFLQWAPEFGDRGKSSSLGN